MGQSAAILQGFNWLKNLKLFGRGDLFSNRYRIIFPVKSVIFEAHSFVNIEQIKQTAALMSTSTTT